jgi:probable phosphoglycerate mutase
MQLYMIRHGQSYVNLKDWEGGNVDAGLTELGQMQAAALAEWLPTELEKIDFLYCSTMKRAQETAEPIANAYDVTPQLDNRLREIGNNRFDHVPWPSDDLPEYGQIWGSERPFHSITPDREGGESLMHFRVRVGVFLEDLTGNHPEQTVVVVCHGGVIETVYDHLFNIGPWRRCEVWSRNTSIAHFEYVKHPNREVWRLHYHGRVEHLQKLKKHS